MCPQEDIDFSELIASSVHDMKNSLSIQVGFLEELMSSHRDKIAPDTLKHLGHTIYEAGRMNANLIQILSLYKLGRSIYPVDISEHMVHEVLNEAVLRSQSIMALKNIAVEVDCSPDCFWYFDRDLVTGALINALNNAYNYTRDRIRVAAFIRDENALEIRVEDNGRGYPEALLNRSVGQGKGSNFTSGSTGMGFYFSSRIASVHHNKDRHGQLMLENGGALGGGCFVLTLP